MASPKITIDKGDKRSCTSFIECDSFCSTFQCSRGNRDHVEESAVNAACPRCLDFNGCHRVFLRRQDLVVSAADQRPRLSPTTSSSCERSVVTGIIFVLAQFALGWVIVRFRDDGRRANY